jgi:DsbC/DsbD-like thiol-disulfide interchange protein
MMVTMALRMINRAAVSFALAMLTGGLYPASAGVGSWADGTKASARLISAGVDSAGNLAAGIEILLPPGWKTYWRDPGESGTAPLLDFSASVNIGEVKVEFPPPHRFDDGYSISNVYQDRVVLPLTVAVADPSDDVRLVVDMRLGVCEVVCIPDALAMSLDVPAEDDDRYAAAVLAAARDLLPGRPEPGVFSVLGVERAGGTDKRPIFSVSAVVPDAANAIVFIEGPEGWYPNVPKFTSLKGDTAAYQVEFSRLGASTPIEGAGFVLVIESGSRAIEQVVTLK